MGRHNSGCRRPEFALPPRSSHSFCLPTSARLRDNNFDLLRLLFAATVCLVHAHLLSGFAALAAFSAILSSVVAVKAFFVVSGFLIVMSYERSHTLGDYAQKRLRRIYPAYAAVVVLCAVGLVTVSSQSAADYFFSVAWFKYLLANLAFLNFVQPSLPGVFDGNLVNAVNGALWTLKIEVMFYLSVPVLVWLMRRLGHGRILLLAYAASIVYAQVLMGMADRTGSGLYAELARQLPGQLSYFVAGAALYYYLAWFERHAWRCLTGAAVALAALHWVPPLQASLALLEPLALAMVVVFLGLFGYLGRFGRYGDFSYGLYILHFPIIQLLLHSGWFRDAPGTFLATVLLTSMAGAVLLWHGVEKRWLLRSSHYVAAEQVAKDR